MELRQVIASWLRDLLSVNEAWSVVIEALIMAAVALIVYAIVRKAVLSAIAAVIKRTRVEWDDVILEHRVYHRLLLTAPFLAVMAMTPFFPYAQLIIRKFCALGGIWFVFWGGLAFISALVDIYNRNEAFRGRPIKGYAQILKILLFLVMAMIAVSVLLGKSPLLLLSGLGAMTAVIMLIFKDTISSLASSLLISFNDLVKVGDWITLPQCDADGTVVDIALHTLRIENADKSVSVIPLSKLTEGSFKSWRGMVEGGARRIKRSLVIDQETVTFLTPEKLAELRDLALLREYLGAKTTEIEAFNRDRGYDGQRDGRRLTNLGTFRAYMRYYLASLPQVRQDLTLLVRQLDPTPEGLPLEIYAFVDTTVFVEVEGIQADIFDHLLAIAPRFGLRIYQRGR
jgi:miniconductance mechanosensitive channel